MRASEIREIFLKFFEKAGHMRVASSSLIPFSDPTLYFTNAGMVQFKDVFLGAEKRAYTRATTSQKCMRVSGKHNDLENVGHTPRHHTFFEMLGNFSFGDYFKEEAIAFAWEFLTKTLKLPKEKLIVTVFEKDDDAGKLWLKHVSKEQIFRLGEKDNFWSMGDTGPCGPCSEILWDFGSGKITKKDLEGDRFMEIWNLVFMQFNRGADGVMTPLPKPSVDTGMGLERLACVLQGKKNNWETDLFVPIIEKIRSIVNLPPLPQGENESTVAMRVIADHVRAASFLIADGLLPSNEGRGYVLRRILRRAIRYGRKLGMHKPFFAAVAEIVMKEMGKAYPELLQHKETVEKVLTNEEERFLETLDRGLNILEEEFKQLQKAKQSIVPGEIVFKLYDTYGFPKDLTELIAREKKFDLDEKGFE
ncbi:MAG: alanine--tRNA ligase, partial [Deltaproteobacteria bacterium RIFCSPLOWO2_02_FULL_46_8]